MKAPNERLPGDGSAQARRHPQTRWGIQGQLPPNHLCASQNFVMFRKFVLTI